MSVDLVARVSGIPGRPPGQREQVELSSWSWGQDPEMGPTLHVGRESDADSRLIRLLQSSGQSVGKVEITTQIGGLGPRGNQTAYYIITLENTLVSSYQSGGANPRTGASAYESLSLNFEEVKVSYGIQRRPGARVRFQTAENPSPTTPGLDLNGDGRPEPLLLPAVQKVREAAARAGSTVVPNDRDGNFVPDHALVSIVDLDGNGQKDAAPTAGRSLRVDLNGDRRGDRTFYVDRNNDRRIDPFFLVDFDGDGLVDGIAGLSSRRR
jgi:type VI protein secretion system component Hcp